MDFKGRTAANTVNLENKIFILYIHVRFIDYFRFTPIPVFQPCNGGDY